MTAFSRLEAKLARRKGVYDPAGLTAWIGRRSLGKAKFQEKAATGRAKAA